MCICVCVCLSVYKCPANLHSGGCSGSQEHVKQGSQIERIDRVQKVGFCGNDAKSPKGCGSELTNLRDASVCRNHSVC